MKNEKAKPGPKPLKKVIEVVDKATVDLCKRRVQYYRERLAATASGYVPGLGSYALYGIKFAASATDLIGDAPTAFDFAPIATVKAKREALARFDNLVEYREGSTRSGSVRVWTLE
jgi:hypothetical protein